MFALVLHLGKLRLREEHSPKATQLVSGRARIQTHSVLAEPTGVQNLCSQTEIVTSGETQDVDGAKVLEPGTLGQVRNLVI